MKAITLYDVALLAGVSYQTVSRPQRTGAFPRQLLRPQVGNVMQLRHCLLHLFPRAVAMPERMKAITLYDVALLAGVSYQTVSRVINDAGVRVRFPASCCARRLGT
jgi:predicted DNA-binding transcriptional regulator AlpA